MSEILSLGLDISSFDDSKKTRLQEYIALFEQLEKYETRKYNPVLGDGLTAFNASIAETGKLVDDLNIKLNSLSSASSRNTTTTNSSTTANNTSNKSVSARAAAAIKAAEAETRLAAATTKNAQSLLTRANAESRAANSALQNANSTTRASLTARNSAAAQQSVASALGVRVAAERQLISANTQLALAEVEMAAGANLSAQAQMKLQSSVDVARVAVVNASTAIQGANAGIAASTQQLALASNGAVGFGRALNSAFGQLRTLAYILPGLGIAGIFNIAFEAIGNVISELGLLDNAVKKEIERQIELNKVISEEFDLRESIKKQREGIYQNTDQSSSSLEREKESLAATGIEAGTLLNKDKQIADKKLKEARDKIPGNNILNDEFQRNSIVVQERLKKEREDINAKLNAKNQFTGFQTLSAKAYNDGMGAVKDLVTSKTSKVIDGKMVVYDKDLEKKKLEVRLQDIIQEEKINNLQIDNTKNYLVALSNSSAANEAINKFNADEARKKRTEIGKDNNDLNIEKARIKFEKETSSLKQKEAALISEKLSKDSNARIENSSIASNNSSTGSEVAIANAKLSNQLTSNQIQLDKELFELRESYRQRFLSAQTEIRKAELEGEAIKNEKIANNDEKSLGDRLVALQRYIDLKQKMQEEEYLKDKERLSLKANDPTAKKELVALEATYKQQKESVSADAEKKAFDITTTSLAKQYNIVKKLNEQNSTDAEDDYAKEVERTNRQFKEKLINYEEYKRRNLAIDKKYRVQIIEEDIKDKKEDIERLKSLSGNEGAMLEKANKNVDTAEVYLQSAKDSGGDVSSAQEGLDIAKGERDAILQAVLKTNGDIEKSDDDLSKLILKKAIAERDKLAGVEDDKQKKRKETLDVIFKVEKAIYDAAKKYSDAEFRIRAEKIDERTQSIVEGYDAEIAAIEKSTISEKDKAALTIQLETQRKEIEKAAAVEQKQLRIEQANFDKQLSIAHILFGTAEAIIAAGAVTPKAIAAGVVGAIQLGVAIATPIPSFAEGVEDFEGGMARYGEAGPEVIDEPNKKPYLVSRETISYLPKGTDVIPIAKYHVEEKEINDNSWEQTIWLAKQMKKNNTKVINKNTIIIDLGFSNYKKQILGN